MILRPLQQTADYNLMILSLPPWSFQHPRNLMHHHHQHLPSIQVFSVPYFHACAAMTVHLIVFLHQLASPTFYSNPTTKPWNSLIALTNCTSLDLMTIFWTQSIMPLSCIITLTWIQGQIRMPHFFSLLMQPFMMRLRAQLTCTTYQHALTPAPQLQAIAYVISSCPQQLSNAFAT